MIQIEGRMNGTERDTGFADLHNHVIPEVDDGSRSLEESLEALRGFHEEGVAFLVATPHLYLQFLDDESQLSRRMHQLKHAFERLRAAMPADGSMPEIHFGQEICAHDAAAVRRVVHRTDVGLGETLFLLIEFGFDLEGDPESVIRCVHESGRRIVIAHPERYRYPPGEDPIDRMRRWRDAGAFLQINLGSLDEGASYYGSDAGRLGWRLIDEGVAHLVSSDHHCRQRPQILHQMIHEAISERGGATQADLLLRENPRRVLRGLDPLPVEGLCGVPGRC